MEHLFNHQEKSQINPIHSNNIIGSLFGQKQQRDVFKSSEKDKINVVETREELFKSLFGTPDSIKEIALRKNNESKIESQDEAPEYLQIKNFGWKIYAPFKWSKANTPVHILISIAFLTVAIFSSWFLFENCGNINLKLILFQLAFFGFILGFKELSSLFNGKKESA